MHNCSSTIPFVVMALLWWGVWGSAHPAWAQESVIEQARAHYQRGRTLEQAGDLAGALGEYQRADELRPAYRLHEHLARVCRGLGRYREALEHAAQLLAEGGDRIDDAWRQDIEQTMALLRSRLAHLRLEAPSEAQVFIDGERVEAAPGAEALDLDPGFHRLEVRLAGHGEFRQDLSLDSGQELTVTAVLPPLVGAEEEVVTAVPGLVPPSSDSASDSFRRRRVHRGWFYGVLGLAASLAVSGGVCVGFMMDRYRTFDQLNQPVRTDSQDAEMMRARRQGTAFQRAGDSLIFLGLGAGLAALVLSFFTDFHVVRQDGA